MEYKRAILFKYFVGKQFKMKDLIGGKSFKWTTLSHNGVMFPDEYQYKKIPILYSGQEIILNEKAEEAAFLYAKYIDTEYITNATFNKNFFNDWKKLLGKDSIIQNLSSCDFKNMKKYLEKEKELKKESKDKKKNKDNKNKDKDDDKYKIAVIDGKEQTVSNYKMEPPAIFIGRGKNPNLGKIKKRIYPEDVILNLGKGVSVPEIIINGKMHKWKKIIHDRNVEWLASWKDTITNKTKYLWLSAHSELKANSDEKKFDLARKLKKKIKTINELNDKNLKSDDIKIKQIATALFFIDKLALRVGNEKGDDSADTVGTTNLRVEHIDVSKENVITLNFLGKDSVPYTNTVTVATQIYNNICEFIKGKEKDEQIFDKINSNDVNKYLQEFMKDLTAKVYRTYNASNVFQKELKKINAKFTDNSNIKELMDEYIKANAKVAKIMNHQKNVSIGYKNNVQKITKKISDLQKKLKEESNSNKTKNIKDKIKNMKSKMSVVKEMKNISLGTSKMNYIDPRISVAFMKKHNVDVNKIFTKTLQNKFQWAFSVDENFKF
jgi:DNA topoisomerase-1